MPSNLYELAIYITEKFNPTRHQNAYPLPKEEYKATAHALPQLLPKFTRTSPKNPTPKLTKRDEGVRIQLTDQKRLPEYYLRGGRHPKQPRVTLTGLRDATLTMFPNTPIFKYFKKLSHLMKKQFFALAISLSSIGANAAVPPQCQQQTVQRTTFEICLLPGAAFQHDLYTVKADKVLLFALVDDYSEKIELEHTLPPGPAIEFPLSQQGEKSTKITGGCLPESKDGVEVARVCNFYWGKFQIAKDVRFEFK